MQELSSKHWSIRIGRKIKNWPGKVLLRSFSRVASSHCNPLVVSTIAHTFMLWYRRGGSAHAQPEYWFSTDAYITTVDKRHLHFDGLRRVHLTFRMHFTGRACTVGATPLSLSLSLSLSLFLPPPPLSLSMKNSVLPIFITQCCTSMHIAICIYLVPCELFEDISAMNLPLRLHRRYNANIANTVGHYSLLCIYIYIYIYTQKKKLEWKSIGKLSEINSKEQVTTLENFITVIPRVIFIIGIICDTTLNKN